MSSLSFIWLGKNTPLFIVKQTSEDFYTVNATKNTITLCVCAVTEYAYGVV